MEYLMLLSTPCKGTKKDITDIIVEYNLKFSIEDHMNFCTVKISDSFDTIVANGTVRNLSFIYATYIKSDIVVASFIETPDPEQYFNIASCISSLQSYPNVVDQLPSIKEFFNW